MVSGSSGAELSSGTVITGSFGEGFFGKGTGAGAGVDPPPPPPHPHPPPPPPPLGGGVTTEENVANVVKCFVQMTRSAPTVIIHAQSPGRAFPIVWLSALQSVVISVKVPPVDWIKPALLLA